MNRPDLEKYKDNLNSWPDRGLGKEKSLEVIDYALYSEKQYSRLAQLNDDQHEQYLVVLDERDKKSDQIEYLESVLARLDYWDINTLVEYDKKFGLEERLEK